MQSSAPQPVLSDWPVGLLLDELWLRSRRALVHELERRHFWLEANRYRPIIAGQLARGITLRQQVLGPVLSPDDMRLLASESLFAAANRRFRTRLPLCLAFGYELGLGFSGAADHCHEKLLRACELAAIFNVGISTFDLLHDTMPKAATEFSTRFNEGALSRLHRGEPSADQTGEFAGVSSEPEVRFLLRIIVCFYSRLNALTDTAAQRRVATNLLTAAYRAEMASLGSGSSRTGSPSISRRKSTLPFHIIRAIVKSTWEAPAKTQVALDALATEVGTLFWLVDDLADVVDDLRCGVLNSIGLLRRRKSDSTVAPAVRTLLESNAIERCVHRIARSVESIVARCDSPMFASAATARLPELLAAYVRNWIE